MLRKKLFALTALSGLLLASAASAETIKFALIEGLSGPFAANGQAALREFTFATEKFINDKGGVAGGTTVEFIGLDNKTSPKESLIQLKNAIGQGVQYVFQGNSSGVANAISAAVEKYNRRNPEKPVLYINYAAVDPALTNEKCNFWHFRFDANADMKMKAIVQQLKDRPEIKKVYLIGQDYSFGKAVAAAARKYLGEIRPDIEIVGEELHPIGKVKDFTPYVTKIKASGADAVFTGNWGSDMVNLAKASNDIGLDADFFTYYAAGTGITATIGAAGKDRIMVVQEGQRNPVVTDAWDNYLTEFTAKYQGADILYPRVVYAIQMLAKAMDEANSVKPLDVALTLEDMKFTTLVGNDIFMRAKDHQLMMPLNIAVHTNEEIKWDYDKSGYGLKTMATIPIAEVDTGTSCEMKRPG